MDQTVIGHQQDDRARGAALGGGTAPTWRPAAGRYVLDPARTGTAFTTRHLFGLGQVRGRVDLLRGHLDLPADGEGLSLLAVLDAASFDTGSRARDRAVTAPRFLDVGRSPEITVTADGWTASAGGPGAAVLDARLTVRGRTAPVRLEVHVHDAGPGQLAYRAAGTVDRYALGVTGARGLSDRYLHVAVEGVAVREAS